MGQRGCFSTMTKTNNWSQIGAWQGGSVSSVVLSPNFEKDGIALAATSAGLFRTQSSGQTWSLAMDGFSDPSALALAYGQDKDGTILLASSEQGRLFRSQDLGARWVEIDQWAGLGIASAIAISPNFAEDKTCFVATVNGIFRTLDDGESWQEASFGLLDLDVICLALAPDFAHSQTLWCGTALGGLFRTRNAGRAWRESGEGLPDCAVQSISLSPNFVEDQTLFAGMEEGGVYRSQDGGRSWNLAGESLAEVGVNGLATVRNSASTVGDSLWAGSSVGLYSSIDGGETWKVELADLPILDLALAQNGAGLAAVYQQGIFTRNLQTGDWQIAANGIVAHAPPQVVQSRSGILLALDSDGELAISENGSADWTNLPAPDEMAPTVAIAAGGDGDEASFYAASMTSIFCMSVADRQWHALLPPPLADDDAILQLALDDSSEQLSIAIGTLQGDLLWLDDETRNWQKLECPWQGVTLLSLFFAEDEDGGTALHALTGAENANQNYDIELWRFDSEFEGGWSSLAALESESPAVLTLATEGSIFLATQNRLIKLFMNSESGELEVAQHFFSERTRITALTQGATNNEIYLATTNAFHRSLDGGSNWEELTPLPTIQPLVSLLPDPAQSTLLAITLGGQAWHY